MDTNRRSSDTSRARIHEFPSINTSNGRILLLNEDSLHGLGSLSGSVTNTIYAVLACIWLPTYSHCTPMLQSSFVMGCILLLSFFADTALTAMSLVNVINYEPSGSILSALFPLPALFAAPAWVGALLIYRRLPPIYGRLAMLWNCAASIPAGIMLLLGIALTAQQLSDTSSCGSFCNWMLPLLLVLVKIFQAHLLACHLSPAGQAPPFNDRLE